MNQSDRLKQDQRAQWEFDTRAILNRLHLRLKDVEVDGLRGDADSDLSRDDGFLGGRMERLMAMTAAVTALGTQLFGRFGMGADQDKELLNRVKKDADAISAYAMSESLWFASRHLPENHAIMVFLGEGLMPKGGESPEMGSNPQLGFGRVYARPQVAQWLDQRVVRLLNDPDYHWEHFGAEIKAAGITVWSAAIDTLENTTRFAKGSDTGPLTILHLFNQPMCVSQPYEGYMGNLILPKQVVTRAAEESLLVDYWTPREKVLQAIEATYPGIRPEDIHVWTLRGKMRAQRIGALWDEWESMGVHVVDDGWTLPSGMAAFADSGTYAPVYQVGTWEEDGRIQLFLCDGYAASAEAMQAASLAPLLDLDVSMSVFTSRFDLSYQEERAVMGLDPEASDFAQRLETIVGKSLPADTITGYQHTIAETREAGLPSTDRVLRAGDFFFEKGWEVAAMVGYMRPDPYTGANGVEQVSENIYRVTVRSATREADKFITFTLRLTDDLETQRLVFSPLLTRFIYGEDYINRPVKISDSGRIRNELQTLCSEALEYTSTNSIRVHFDRILPEVISIEDQKVLLDVLNWYREHHSIWFKWLEIVPPSQGFASQSARPVTLKSGQSFAQTH